MGPRRRKRTGNNSATAKPPKTAAKRRGGRKRKSRLKEEAHPMTNPVVLSVLFEKCPIAMLKNIRQVCRQWRDVSLAPWRRNAVLRVTHPDQPPSHYSTGRKAIPSQSLSRCLRPLPEIVDKPFTSLNIVSTLREPGSMTPCLLQSLSFDKLTYLKITRTDLTIPNIRDLVFSETSPPLNTLILDSVSVLIDDTFAKMSENGARIEDFIPETSLSLKRFELGCCEFEESFDDDEDDDMRLPSGSWGRDDLVRAFLIKAPNLHTLYTGGDTWESEEEQGRSFLDGVDLSLLKLKVLDISGMNIDCKQPTGLISGLRELSLLELRINTNNVYTIGEFRNVFGNNSESLRKLHVSRDTLYGLKKHRVLRKDPNDKIIFPNLEELHMEDGVKTAFGFLSLLSCPKLTEVTLVYRQNPTGTERFKLPELREIDVVVPSVTRINISRSNLDRTATLLTPNEVERIAAVFPNVQDLRMATTKAQFGAVCKSFGGLRCLHILSYDDDSVYKQKQHEVLDDEGITGFNGKLKGGIACPPNITNLTQLREFSLKPEPSEESVYLTDHSVHNGFLKLPQLYTLRFNMTKVSKAARKTLEARIPDSSDYPKGCGNE